MEYADLEEEIMALIIAAGEGKSAAFMALAAAKKGDGAQALTLLDQANQHLHDAHEVQTRLIGLDEGCGKLPVTLVMVHAQDHLMTAMLARDLISEMVALYSFPRHAA